MFLIVFLMSLQTFPFTLKDGHLLRVLPLISRALSLSHVDTCSLGLGFPRPLALTDRLKPHQVFPAPESGAVSEHRSISLNLRDSSWNLVVVGGRGLR